MPNKPAWLYQQSAAIPYFKNNNDIFIVVLVSSSSKSGWVFPKGVIERFMTPEVSAAQEALEEAGVIGTVGLNPIEEYKYEKWGGVCHVKVYPLEVNEILETWDEMELRDRIFVQLDEAAEMVKPQQKSSIEKLINFLKKRKNR